MGTCEMCGKQTESLNLVKVAGSLMNVCNNCKPLGKSQEIESNLSKTFYKKKKIDVEFEVVENYQSLITSAMTKKGIDLHQLARVIGIKESTLNKFMSKKFSPELDIARRIGNYFDIKLIKEIEVKSPSLILEQMRKEDTYQPENLADMIIKKMNEEKNKK